MKHLVLGGARSGKSVFAEQQILDESQASNAERIYIATAEALDHEMSDRIRHHRDRRANEWTLIEEPVALASILEKYNADHAYILVDCLTLWLSNCLHKECWDKEFNALLDIFPTFKGRLVLVSNEVGSGIVPLGELSRTFVDEAGRVNQALAKLSERVTLVVAGLPLELKSGI